MTISNQRYMLYCSFFDCKDDSKQTCRLSRWNEQSGPLWRVMGLPSSKLLLKTLPTQFSGKASYATLPLLHQPHALRYALFATGVATEPTVVCLICVLPIRSLGTLNECQFSSMRTVGTRTLGCSLSKSDRQHVHIGT